MTAKHLAALGSVVGVAPLLLMTPNLTVAQTAQSDQATGSLQEVVVTAQRREEKQVDVPISIAAISAQQLATANVTDLRDVAQLTPSIRFDNQAGFFQPTIRGIGTSVTTSGGGSNVGIYIDGFYSPNPLAADLQLLNVSGVQVLKGPQGTLFGRNTTGGAILVTTNDPSEQPHAEAKVDYGSFNAQQYQGYATGGLAPGIAADIEGIFAKGNGFLTNIIDGNDHVDAYENWTVRTGLKWAPSETFSALLRYTHSREDDPTSILTNSNTDTSIDPTTGKPWGVETLTFPGYFTTNPNQVAETLPTFVRSNTDIAQLTLKADVGVADVTSYSQWRQEDVSQSENLTQAATPSPFTPGTFQLGLPIFDSTLSQEILVTSKPGTSLQWTTGVFVLNTRDQYITYIDTYKSLTPALRALVPLNFASNGEIPLGGSSTTTKSYAAYLDATYEILPDKLYFTAGARYSRDLVDDAYYNARFTRARNYEPGINANKVTPRAVIRYKPTDRSSVYASFSEGYKARIIDVGGSCQDSQDNFQCNPIQPEQVLAYEVGYKFETPDFSNEAAFFDYQYKNLQVSEFLAQAQAYIVNAAQSRIYGFEDEFHYNWENHFQLNGGVSWTHARYTTFGTPAVGAPIYQTCPGGPAGPNRCYIAVSTSSIIRGAHMQHTPDWTANVGPRYTTGETSTGEYAVSSNVYFTSYYFNSPAGTEFRQPSYTTVTLRAQWDDPSKHYTVALYGNNVTNVRYRTAVQYNGFGIGASWDAPATWGIELGAKF